MDMSLFHYTTAADIKRQEGGASWISGRGPKEEDEVFSLHSFLPLTILSKRVAASACMWKKKNIIGWPRKFMLGGSTSSCLLPVVAAGAPRPSSQRCSSAAAKSISISVSVILLGDSGSFPPPPNLSSANSSPSPDTGTSTPFSTTGENAAPDATASMEPLRTRRSGSPPEPPAPPVTATSVAKTTNKDALKVLFVIIAASITIMGFINDINSSWKTGWKVLYGVLMMLSLVSTVTSLYTAGSPAESWAGTLSAFCGRFGLLVATGLYIVFLTCQLGTFECVAGVPTAALAVLFLAVVWWKCSVKPA